MRRAHTLFLLLALAVCAQAQLATPVKFTAELKTNGTAEGEMVFSGKIDPGWHVYSTRLGNNGPVEASLHPVRLEGVELVGSLTARGNELSRHDPVFGMTLRFFEQAVQFVQKVRFTRPQYAIDCYLEYGACSDQACLPPAEVVLKTGGTSPKTVALTAAPATETPEKDKDKTGGSQAAEALPPPASAAETVASAVAAPPALADSLTADIAADTSLLYRPVVQELRALGGEAATDMGGRPWYQLLLMGFIGGLLALVMPCIWPVIPMTVSFFLKRAKDDRRQGVRDALTYGLSIVVIYLTLGLAVTALFGPSKLNELSTHAVFNLLLFALLVVFALSFFGWFELRLPDRWANAVDARASRTSGLLSIFLMAFTLALVSFSCTAPIIGLLLVETVTSGHWVAPAVGMAGFALALALPFTLFALFPSWLRQAPKSGAWMNTVKVTLGFIELAFALKFFSVADLAYGWHLLDREVFLSLWIAIFTLLGAYLLGLFRFQSDLPEGTRPRPMPVVCIMGGLVSLAFAVYMVPGLWGAPCKAVSAFAPPMSTQDFNLSTRTVEARYTSYEEGLAAARAQGKPVLLDFTGFGCVNCRKMEAAVWTDPQVASLLTNDYVLVSLYVDDRQALSRPFTVEEDGQRRTLTTAKEKWSWLQAHKYGANTQPFYVAVDGEGRPLAAARSYDENPARYVQFLREGLDRFRRQAAQTAR